MFPSFREMQFQNTAHQRFAEQVLDETDRLRGGGRLRSEFAELENPTDRLLVSVHEASHFCTGRRFSVPMTRLCLGKEGILGFVAYRSELSNMCRITALTFLA